MWPGPPHLIPIRLWFVPVIATSFRRTVNVPLSKAMPIGSPTVTLQSVMEPVVVSPIFPMSMPVPWATEITLEVMVGDPLSWWMPV